MSHQHMAVKRCWVCGQVLGTDDAPYQSLKNRNYGASENGEECCEWCAQDAAEVEFWDGVPRY